MADASLKTAPPATEAPTPNSIQSQQQQEAPNALSLCCYNNHSLTDAPVGNDAAIYALEDMAEGSTLTCGICATITDERHPVWFWCSEQCDFAMCRDCFKTKGPFTRQEMNEGCRKLLAAVKLRVETAHQALTACCRRLSVIDQSRVVSDGQGWSGTVGSMYADRVRWANEGQTIIDEMNALIATEFPIDAMLPSTNHFFQKCHDKAREMQFYAGAYVT